MMGLVLIQSHDHFRISPSFDERWFVMTFIYFDRLLRYLVAKDFPPIILPPNHTFLVLFSLPLLGIIAPIS